MPGAFCLRREVGQRYTAATAALLPRHSRRPLPCWFSPIRTVPSVPEFHRFSSPFYRKDEELADFNRRSGIVEISDRRTLPRKPVVIYVISGHMVKRAESGSAPSAQLYNVVSELGGNNGTDASHGHLFAGLFEPGHHLAGTEPAQVSTFGFGGTG